MDGDGWRPIEPHEVPHLEALGDLLHALRDDFGLTQVGLGRLANVAASTVGAIERARRRTRRSTLERIVGAVIVDDPERAEQMLAEMVTAAGPALALEEDEAQRQRMLRRLERRGRRWESKDLAETILHCQEMIRSLQRRVWLDEHYESRRDTSAARRRLLDKLRENLERLQAIEAEREDKRPSHRGRTRSDRGPAWHAWQDLAREIFGGRRGSGSISSFDLARDPVLAAKVAKLDRLKALADAEEAERGR